MPAAVQECIERSLAKSRVGVFVRADFACFDTPPRVGRALRAALDEDFLARIGAGMYASAAVQVHKSSPTAKPIPAVSLVKVGQQAFAQLGVKAEGWNSAQSYASGRTTQILMVIVHVDKSLVVRRIGFGHKAIRY